MLYWWRWFAPTTSRTARRLASDETVAHGVGGGRGPRVDAELVEDVGDVAADGARADEEDGGDLAVGLPLGDQAQDVQLALRQPVHVRHLNGIGRRGGDRRNDRQRVAHDRVERPRPPRFDGGSSPLSQRGGDRCSAALGRVRRVGVARRAHRLAQRVRGAEEARGTLGLAWRGNLRQPIQAGGDAYLVPNLPEERQAFP